MKEHYQELEEQVKLLTERVRVLDWQVNHYRNLLLANGISESPQENHAFINDEQFHWTGLANTIKETPELVKVTFQNNFYDI